ncbi:stromelysin-1-like [Tribolium castaneum]|uniref:stromelysin-1-like n=1 Tax=Tribolium castaneum TaxID=7070 RepID=UPI00077DC16D|nr:PREDICTED: stromelysin-1-like [Tribolium castaneum]|eukprot:XP_015836133.1 PREDICTED: stromelysin-1-like [Tribolium castaneum]
MMQKSRTLVIFLILMHFSLEKNLDVKQILYESGYLESLNVDPEDLKAAIEKYQKKFGLTVTGNITEELIKKMSVPRCAKPYNLRTNEKTPGKWTKSHITYKIKNSTTNVPESVVRRTFEKFITEWTDKIDLKITEAKSDKADIQVHFTVQDGPYNNLGYAYFPNHGGDIFFDQDEEWIDFWDMDGNRINFNWVLGHELGHALGLPHDDESPNSIMSTYYTSVLRPSKADLKNIKCLYGAAKPNISVLCQQKTVDVLLKTENLILIKGTKYWTIFNNTVQAGPFSLELLYPELPDRIDAAISVKNVVYFFKNNVFFKFIKGRSNFARKLISVGFESVPNNIDTAFFDPSANYIYFFKGSKYYIFDFYKTVGKRMIVENKTISNDWPIPDNIEAATLINNSLVLFIKNFTCYTVNVTTKELTSEQSCARFYGC